MTKYLVVLSAFAVMAYGQQTGPGGVPGPGSSSGGGATTNPLTGDSSGAGAAAGTTFNGSSAVTFSYNTLGAAPLASPAFTGSPTAPTQTAGDATTKLATDAFVTNAVSSIAGGNYYGGTSTGSANVQAITLPAGLGAPTLAQLTGIPITFLAGFANTSVAPTLAVNGLGAAAIVKGNSTVLAAGDLAASTMALVVYNGANFVLQNPQVLVTQTGAIGGFSLGGTLAFSGTNGINTQSIRGNSATAPVNITGGNDGGNATEGPLTMRGGTTTSSTGVGGNTILEAGAAPSTGTQGLASMQESFTVASVLAQTFEAVSMGTTADQVQAAALGSANKNLGIAQTVGGTNTQLYVATNGKSTVRFDGTPVVGDIACFPPASTGTAGLAHDNGSTACPAGQKLGVITGQVSGTGSGATATVLLQIGS